MGFDIYKNKLIKPTKNSNLQKFYLNNFVIEEDQSNKNLFDKYRDFVCNLVVEKLDTVKTLEKNNIENPEDYLLIRTNSFEYEFLNQKTKKVVIIKFDNLVNKDCSINVLFYEEVDYQRNGYLYKKEIDKFLSTNNLIYIFEKNDLIIFKSYFKESSFLQTWELEDNEFISIFY